MTIIHDDRNSIPRAVTFSCNCCRKHFIRYSNKKPKLDYRILKRNQHFCSHTCAYAARQPTKAKEIRCDNCNKSICRPPSLIKETNFCSRKCYWKYRKIDPRVKAPRKPCSEERKRKISKANKGMRVRLGRRFHKDLFQFDFVFFSCFFLLDSYF